MANWVAYGKALLNALGGETASESYSMDLLSDTIKIALFKSSYSPNQDSDELYSALSNEVSASGTNYTTGGVALSNQALSYTAPTNKVQFSNDTYNVEWTSASFTARYAVIYDADNSLLIAYADFGEDKTVLNGTFTLELADEIMEIVVN